ncbi:MAG: tetratricopeptide repeat protein, partial [Bacteroidales bacterium]|nr:tetratricopeptide repeat protein [Bacteroidales bacterium]
MCIAIRNSKAAAMNLNHTKNALAIILLLIAPAISFAQNRNTTDSLKSIIAKTNQDTTKIHTYLNLSREYQYLNLDSAFFYSDQALKKSLNINYKKGIADAYRQKGVITILLNNYKLADSLLNVAISGYREIYYQFGIMECYIGLAGIAYNKGNNHLLLDYSEKALKIAEEKDLTDYSAMILLNIGLAYTKLGNYEKAIKYGLDALKIFEELNNKKMIAGCNINIGNFFIEIKEPDKGLAYMSKALKIYTKLEDTENQSFCYTNIGAALAEMKKYNKALQNFNDALKLDLTNNDLIGVSVNYNNIGSIYRELGQYEMATEYFNKSLKIKEQIGDKRGTAICYHNITQTEIKLKNYKIAEEYCLKSI